MFGSGDLTVFEDGRPGREGDRPLFGAVADRERRVLAERQVGCAHPAAVRQRRRPPRGSSTSSPRVADRLRLRAAARGISGEPDERGDRMDWPERSHAGRRGVAAGARGASPSDRGGQGKYHYVYGPYVEPVLGSGPATGRDRDARRLQGAVKTEADLPTQGPQHALRQPAERADRGRGGSEGRRAGGRHRFDPAARAAAGRYHGADSRVWRAGGHAHTAMLNPSLPERVKKMVVDRGRACSATGSRCPTSRSSARSASRPRSRR